MDISSFADNYCDDEWQLTDEIVPLERVIKPKTKYKYDKLKQSTQNREYHKRNPHTRRGLNAKRRAAELNALPPWYDLEKKRIINLYKEAREMREDGIDVNVDHVIPLQGVSVCGLHTIANLKIIPSSENFSKGNTG